MDDVVKTDEDHIWGSWGEGDEFCNRESQTSVWAFTLELAPEISLYLYCQRSTPLVQSR